MSNSSFTKATNRQGQAAYSVACLAYIDEIAPKLLTCT